MNCLKETFCLDMNHVELGTLNETNLMVLFGNYHSLFLTHGLSNHSGQIVDSKNNILYPAYFMTYLKVPPSSPLNSFSLWDQINMEIKVKRYGDTILDSTYCAKSDEEQVSPGITMQANSLFILDPSVFRTQHKQASAPKSGAVCELERLNAPPTAIQDAPRIRSFGFKGSEKLCVVGEPYYYTLEFDRDTAPGHPLIFAKIPLLMELSERAFLSGLAKRCVSQEILQAVSLLERKTFYYGNAFAGSNLTLYTKGVLEVCNESLWKENPRLEYIYKLTCETELYNIGNLLAISRSEKVIVHEIHNRSAIQDTKRLFKPTYRETGAKYE